MFKCKCLMLKKPICCSVLFNLKFCSYFQESNQENNDFSIFEHIRVTVSLGGTFSHMEKTYAFTRMLKSSLMFYKWPNFTGENLGNKIYLDCKYIRIRLTDMSHDLTAIFDFA